MLFLGGTVGGALGGPAGALSLGGLAATEGAVKGGLAGGTIGSGVYGVKRAMAKRRDPKGFKKSFDYSKNEENMIEFKRGKDKMPRKKRQNKLGGHVKKGAKIGATIGALSNAAGAAAMAKGGAGKKLAAALGGAGLGAVSGGLGGATWGAGTYGAKKLLAKNRGKENFDYSKNTEGVKMFIGQQDESSINFARPKGAKDKMPRKKSGLRTAAKVGAGLAGAAGIGAAGLAAVKNRKAIGGALRNAGGAVRDTAMVGEIKARQMGRKGMNVARSGAIRVGDAVGGASSAVQGGVSSGVSKLRSTASKFEQRGRDVMASQKAAGQRRQTAATQQQKYRLQMGGRR